MADDDTSTADIPPAPDRPKRPAPAPREVGKVLLEPVWPIKRLVIPAGPDGEELVLLPGGTPVDPARRDAVEKAGLRTGTGIREVTP